MKIESTTRAAAGLALVLGLSQPAQAVQFEIGEVFGSLDSFFTLGAAIRTESRDPDLIAKVNLLPGLCTGANTTENGGTGPRTYWTETEYASRGFIGGTCNSTTDPALNQAYVDLPGSYNINGDNGNLNFDRGDIVSAAAKLNSKLALSWGNFNFLARGIWVFNDTYVDFDDVHPDTTLQPGKTPLGKGGAEEFGTHFELTEAFISTFLPIGDREVTLRVGRQGFVWGESNALPLNSINTVNPADQARMRTPGFDLGELFRPVGMVYMSTDLSTNLALEMFYQYEWLPVRIDAPGTFYSVSDVLGGKDTDGQYAMLSFGKAPEDPFSVYQSQDNDEDPFALGSASGRTLYRTADIEPRDGGQYGFALKYFAENFNNGTEFGFYFTNTHSRIPAASFTAAQQTCAVDATNAVEFADACGAGQGSIGTLGLSDEPLPVDTASLFAEYPEDRLMFGVSFNTTIGDFAWAGEYTFRPNHPTQIHTVDLTYAALQPAFPRNNINIGLPPDLDPLNVGGAPAAVLPGRRMAVPDYVETIYRQNEVQPGQYIRGYEELQQGQLVTSLLRTLGAAENPFGASQVLILTEIGVTHIYDMPSLNEIQFQGGESNTHASRGADGTSNGIADSADLTNGTETDGDGDPRCVRQAFASIGGAEAEPCRQNPTAQNADNFGDEIAYGIRILTLTKYEDFFRGWNFEPLVALFYDIDGVAPGLGQNFVEGNLTALVGLRFDYLSQWFTELRYTYLDGDKNSIRDRDNLMFTLQYNF